MDIHGCRRLTGDTLERINDNSENLLTLVTGGRHSAILPEYIFVKVCKRV